MKRGFTLIELMVVIAIIGILTALIAFGMRGSLHSYNIQEDSGRFRRFFYSAQKKLQADTLATTWEIMVDENTQKVYGRPGGAANFIDTLEFNPNDSIDIVGPSNIDFFTISKSGTVTSLYDDYFYIINRNNTGKKMKITITPLGEVKEE